MIDSVMYVGIGLLLGCLLGVAFVPFVQNRALAVRRLEGRLPQSIGEIQADKDLLRAEFAMSARRLEIIIEQLRNKITNQLVELSKKSNIINRLNLERMNLRPKLRTSEERSPALKRQLKAPDRYAAPKNIVVGAISNIGTVNRNRGVPGSLT